MRTRSKLLALLGIGALAFAAATTFSAPAPAGSKAGTTLAAVKTLDICLLGSGDWLFSGEIAVWNEGAVDTEGLVISDFIQTKLGAGQFQDTYGPVTLDPVPTVIPKGTTQATALIFTYSITGAPLPGDIRNIARITITNHSGSIGTPKGPQPKASWLGEVLPCDQPEGQCVYTQGYWGNKPGVIWPDGFDRNASFYLSGKTWQQVLDTPPSASQGYYQLAHQFIAAILNQTNGSPVPAGIQTILDNADTWLQANAPSACTGKGSCGTQKAWAAILDDYNNGDYPGGPQHCGDE